MNLQIFFLVTTFVVLPHADCSPHFPALDHIISSTPLPPQADAAKGVISRLVPNEAHKFSVKVDDTIGTKFKDTFQLTASGGEVSITATSGYAAAWGFYYYLSQFCHAHISWAGIQVKLPETLPDADVKITSNDRFRYYQNVCTVSYSMAWWDWARWEREIDWMAMNAINLPLAFNGQEAIWNRVYLKMGFTQEEIDAHFGGPAFLAWARMGNMRGWGGPLSQAWHADQLALQHKILDRMRSLGIIPVLPAFSGHVPAAFTRLFPNASVSRLSDWGHFNDTYCCVSLLDVEDPQFPKVGQAFLTEYIAEFGTDHMYNTDTFNEMTPKSSEPSYLTKAGQAVYNAMTVGDEKAIWVMQGWLFQSGGFWKAPQAEALLTSVPIGKMVVLDLFSEVSPIYNKFSSYFGQPFIWCMLHDFGGTVAMYGAIESVNTGPFTGRAFANSTMIGTGLTPEGINQNNVIYEFMNEHAWRTEPRDINKWVVDYSRRRYGVQSANAEAAWQKLATSIYNCTEFYKDHSYNVIVNVKPRFGLVPAVWYKPEDLYSAWDDMMQAASSDISATDNLLFRYDFVDVTRQSLQVIMIKYYDDLINAAKARDIGKLNTAGDDIMYLLTYLDYLLASDEHFLLGPWIEAARGHGTTSAEADLYEYNARNQVTLWGPRGEIMDYANKQWAGLISGYYLPRWQLFIFQLKDAYYKNVTFNQNQYNSDVFKMVEAPFTFSKNKYPTQASGDAFYLANMLYEKYRPMTKQHSKFFSNLPERTSKFQGFQADDWPLSRYGNKSFKKHSNKLRHRSGNSKFLKKYHADNMISKNILL